MRWGWSAAVVFALITPFLPSGRAGDSDESGCFLIEEALDRWEHASAGLMGVGPMEDRRLFYFYGRHRSAHEIALVNEFRGPVSAADLQKRFEWTLRQAGKNVVMVGVPTDVVERLFYKRCEVTLDPKTHLPRAVRFAEPGRNRMSEPLAVVASPRYEEPRRFEPAAPLHPVQAASREGHLPRPSPLKVAEHVVLKPVPEPHFPADLRQILRTWETAGREVQSLKARVQCSTYDHHAQIEHRSEGELTYSARGVRCTLKPAKLSPNQTSARTAADGSPYQLSPAPAEHWESAPREIRLASHQKQPQEADVPAAPLLFPGSVGHLAERFQIQATQAPHADSRFQRIQFLPRQNGDCEMEILLETSTGLPRAVKLVGPAHDQERVFAFDYTEINRQTRPLQSETPKREPAPTDLHGQP